MADASVIIMANHPKLRGFKRPLFICSPSWSPGGTGVGPQGEPRLGALGTGASTMAGPTWQVRPPDWGGFSPTPAVTARSVQQGVGPLGRTGGWHLLKAQGGNRPRASSTTRSRSTDQSKAQSSTDSRDRKPDSTRDRREQIIYGLGLFSKTLLLAQLMAGTLARLPLHRQHAPHCRPRCWEAPEAVGPHLITLIPRGAVSLGLTWRGPPKVRGPKRPDVSGAYEMPRLSPWLQVQKKPAQPAGRGPQSRIIYCLFFFAF